jgi:biopolymer transport protein TolQ
MNNHSLLELIINASLPVQLVMLLLLGASVFSWALMYVKRGYIRQSQAEAKDFEGRFWSGLNLNELFSQLSQRQERRFGLEAIFENGFREFARARKAELRNSESVRSAHRAMKVAMAREVEMLENNLTFLATVGSVSPYVGLFGTVWGIMESFRALAGVQQATLAMVAPGISSRNSPASCSARRIRPNRGADVKKRRAIADINVVPYIDVMLVLLIIFMVTAPLLKQGVDVDLPNAPANPLDVDSPEPIVVSVDRKGAMFLNIAAESDAQIDAVTLVKLVKAALLKEPKRPVMVRGDANGPYQNVVTTLVLLQQADVGSVGLVTDPEEAR